MNGNPVLERRNTARAGSNRKCHLQIWTASFQVQTQVIIQPDNNPNNCLIHTALEQQVGYSVPFPVLVKPKALSSNYQHL